MTADRRNIESVYPLSPMQEGMLYHTLLAPDAGFYFQQTDWTIKGNLDVECFSRTWEHLMARHPILRTAFVWQGLDKMRQVVVRKVGVPLTVEDWRTVNAVEQHERLSQTLSEERRKGFHAAHAPLFRLTLIRMSDEEFRFIWSHHHVLLDGWSNVLLLKEVTNTYEALARGTAPACKPVRPFRDYIKWLASRPPGEAEQYWRTRLAGFHRPTPLPGDRGPARRTAPERQREITAVLSEESTTALRNWARRQQLTMNTLVQGAWGLILSRHSGDDDVVFGATVSGRPPDLAGVEGMVGLFINTIPVRVTVDENALLTPWLRSIQAHQIDSQQYDYAPLVDVQGWSEIGRGCRLFESLVVFENYSVDAFSRVHGVREHSAPSSFSIEDSRTTERANFALKLVVAPGTRLALRFTCDADRFLPDDMKRVLDRLQLLLERIPSVGGDTRVSALSMTSALDLQQVTAWGASTHKNATGGTVVEMFRNQVERDATAVALKDAAGAFTYGELNRRANRLAWRLREHGVGPETLVALCLDRGAQLVTAMLAVLKGGGAYVPLDPRAPAGRTAKILSEARPAVVITDHESHVFTQTLTSKALEACEQLFQTGRDDDPPVGVAPDNLVYVIYTSGSTGAPKGVAVTHRGLVNYLNWAVEACRSGPGVEALLHTSPSFDLTITSLWPALVSGAAVRVLSPTANLDEAGQAWESTERALIKATPSHLCAWQLLGRTSGSGVLVVGGEPLVWSQAENWMGRARVINHYGPTETVVGCCVQELDSGRIGASVPIGRPIPNMRGYVVDSAGRLLPADVPGELYIGGVGVSRGYVRRPGLTAERFVPDGFSGEAGTRLYRTGDQVKWRPDGTLEFLGRRDWQVKIRGHRIEPAEIEAVLEEHPEVRQCAVAIHENNGEKELIAYIVPDSGAEPSQLEGHLRPRLPEYMMPRAIVRLDGLPLTPNGKLDRNALRLLEIPRTSASAAGVRPRDTVEAHLKQIWESVLGISDVDIRDNFFELGGHSLKAVTLASRLEQAYERRIPLQVILEHSTIERLAAYLRQKVSTTVPSSIVAIQSKGSRLPLFCIHPAGGLAHPYVDLARRLGQDQPVYAFQSHGLAEGQSPVTDIRVMAANYVHSLKSVQEAGPYQIAGVSLGAVIAYEMAQQLTASGDSVSLLAMLDGAFAYERKEFFAEGWESEIQKWEEDYIVDHALWELHIPVEDMRRLTPEERLERYLEGTKARDLVPRDVTAAQFRRFVRVYATNVRAMACYAPEPYSGRVTLFRTGIPEGADPSFGLGRLVPMLDVHVLPGTHGMFIYEPGVAAFAELLKAAMDRARDGVPAVAI